MSAKLRETSAVEAGFHPEQIERIRQRGAEWIDNYHTQSLVLFAARRGKIGLYESFGVQSFD